jgi:hypothetical protein
MLETVVSETSEGNSTLTGLVIQKHSTEHLLSFLQCIQTGARGSVAGWGTMLQIGRSPVQVADKVDFYNPSNRTMALGSTQPLTEISTRNLPGG